MVNLTHLTQLIKKYSITRQRKVIVKSLTMEVIELESPEQFGVTILPKRGDIRRKDGYSLICSFQTNRPQIIQEIAQALERHRIKCEITNFTIPGETGNVFNLWAKADFTFSVRFIKRHHGLTW